MVQQLAAPSTTPDVAETLAFDVRSVAETGGLADLDTRTARIGPGTKAAAATVMAVLTEQLADLQERLFAAASGGSPRSVLLVLQGMDTAGKDGVVKAVVRPLDPAGVRITSFKRPTPEELRHDFLWRIERAVPPPGFVGVFNRSHYEDVLVVRVHRLVPEAVCQQRFEAINEFEERLADQDVTVVKCFLHVSPEVQRERFLRRLQDPAKHWKFNPADLDERERWQEYQAAYLDVLVRCSTSTAPWYVVPSDRKWYRNWLVAALLTQRLQELDPQFPPASFDVAAQLARLG
jgi:PPK2 family polyphosphate:nucleotide phosphotransferase